MLSLRPGLATVGTIWLLVSWFAATNIGVLLVIYLLNLLGVPVRQLLFEQKNVAFVAFVSFSYAPFVFGLIYLVYGAYFRRTGQLLRRFIGFGRGPKGIDAILAIPAFIVYFLLSSGLTLIVTQLVPGADLGQKQDLGINQPSTIIEYVVTFLMVVIIPPLVEETLFRGFLFSTLRRGFGVIAAIVVTSVLFGVAHGQLNLFLDTFALSVVLCSLRTYTGALWASILLHACKNGLAFVLLYFLHMG